MAQDKRVAELEAQAAVLREALEAYDPPMPPMLEGETVDEYTNRLTGADGTGRVPYKEHRFRQCSIGYHDECSDPEGKECKCPCHQFERLRKSALSSSAGRDLLERVRKLKRMAEVAEELLGEFDVTSTEARGLLIKLSEALVALKNGEQEKRCVKEVL